MEENKKSTDIGTWIPQLFYDVIARIIPGFFVLLILLINIVDADQFITYFQKILFVDKSFQLSSNLLVLFGIGISYIFAIVLRAISWIIFHPINKKNGAKVDNEYGTISTEIPLSELGLLNSNFKTNEAALRYDFIKLNDSVNGNRITKLKAEEQMSSILFVGSIISSLSNGVLMISDYSQSRLIVLLTTLVIAFFCYIAKVHFHERMQIAIFNCSEFLGFQKYLKHLIKQNKSKHYKSS